MVPELRVMPHPFLKPVIRVVVVVVSPIRHLMAKPVEFMVLSEMQCLLFAEVVFELGDGGVLVWRSSRDSLVGGRYVHLVVFEEIVMVCATVPMRAMVRLLVQDIRVAAGILQVTLQIWNRFLRREMSGL